MKLFRMFIRGIRDAFKSVFRNFSLSLASITCTTITLIIVGVAIIASYNVNNFAENIKKTMTMVVFLNNETTKEEAEETGKKIEKLDNIDTITFKSKVAAKNEMKQDSEFLNSIMSQWEDDEIPLKDSYVIQVKNLETMSKTAEEIQLIEHVSVVSYGAGAVEKVVSAFKIIEKVSICAVIALIIVTVFLIINTIKLTIFSRKREISIMRLVGASNFTIKVPFVIEGMFLGFLGAIIPVLAIIFGYFYFFNYSEGQLLFPVIKLISPEPFVYVVSLIVIAIGMIVGMIGSASAVKKYLKV